MTQLKQSTFLPSFLRRVGVPGASPSFHRGNSVLVERDLANIGDSPYLGSRTPALLRGPGYLLRTLGVIPD